MDGKQKKKLFALLGIMVPLCIVAMVFLVMLVRSKISLLADIGLFFIFLLLVYAIVELVLFHYASAKSKAMGRKEERIRKSIAVFLAVFAFSVLVAEVYPPFADNPVETVFLLLAFSYAVSEIVVYFLWSGDEKKEAYEQPVRLSVIMALFVLLLLVMLSILCLMRPGKVSPAVVADETRATTFITHPTRVIESATTEERDSGEGAPAAGTIIKEEKPHGEQMEAVSLIDGEYDVQQELPAESDASVSPDDAFEAFAPVPVTEEAVNGKETAGEVFLLADEPASETASPSVPSVPVISTPFAVTYESSPHVEEEDDFWADFYIQGEELVLADGTYYFDLYVNDSHAGLMQVELEGGSIRIVRDDFIAFVRDNLTSDALTELQSTPEYVSLDELGALGIRSDFDSSLYEIRVYFSTDMMPVTTLSLRSTTRASSFKPNDGNILLYPVNFSWLTQYSISLGLYNLTNRTLDDAVYVDFDSDNRIRLYDLNLDFSYAFRYSNNSLKFHMGSYQFFYDFVDSQIRLKWGNVSSDLLSPSGTNIGIRFDKSYAYASSNYMHKSHTEQYIEIEKDSEVTVYNGDVEIYRKTLEVGKYRLLDFTLFTGANEIRIVIKPLDGSAPIEKTFSLNYSYSLLAPGEILYGASLTTGRAISSERYDYGLSIPYFNDEWINYDFRNITFSGYLKAGLSESVTLNTALAVQNKPDEHSPLKVNAVLANELIIAESFGYSLLNFKVNEYSNEEGNPSVPAFYFRLGQQFYSKNKLFSGVNLGLTYYSPNYASDSDYHKVSTSISTSLRYGIMNYSISGSVSFHMSDVFETSWYATNSLNFLLGKRTSVNASLTLNANGLDITSVSGRITGTISWDGGSSYIAAGTNDASMSVNATGERHRLNASVNTDDITSFEHYRMSAAYGYSGKWVNFSFDAAASEAFDNIGVSATLSTSSLFAGGRFVFGSYIPSNYLLISQDGALKGNKVSVGTHGYSAGTEPDVSLGTYLYTRVDSEGENIAVYSYNDNSFGSASVFNISLMPSERRKGYVFKAAADDKYSVSGIVDMPDGYLWADGSSPVYSIMVDDDGSIMTELTDYYLFTDSDGRYVMSDMKPGLYGFDVNLPDGWALVIFPVLDQEERVFDLQTVSSPTAVCYDGPSVYSYVFESRYEKTITADEFWEDVFGGAWE